MTAHKAMDSVQFSQNEQIGSTQLSKEELAMAAKLHASLVRKSAGTERNHLALFLGAGAILAGIYLAGVQIFVK